MGGGGRVSGNAICHTLPAVSWPAVRDPHFKGRYINPKLVVLHRASGVHKRTELDGSVDFSDLHS